jgi:hypothetical protein
MSIYVFIGVGPRRLQNPVRRKRVHTPFIICSGEHDDFFEVGGGESFHL